ncbi:hypothetical protein KI688_007562 [Linnemannia hyalina]|uniref:Uncharacterized protein n=1 Tax=Linnemannia hyalina TaxID=64524 RepID=A0A9P8BM32_9FUNG|nr:hypothetical protein KI688_007562 [Linnemannia hyalina]
MDMFYPHLWRAIDINWNDHLVWKKDIIDALQTNNHLIQSLKLRADTSRDRLLWFLELELPTFPHLTSLELEGPFKQDEDPDFAAFINLTPGTGLKRLVFSNPKTDNYFALSRDSFEAIFKHAHTLQVFRIEAMSFLTSTLIDKLLCSAPHLKELYLLNSQDSNSGHWLDAPEIIHSQWVCSDLEVFACRIENISRPDIKRTIAGLDPSKMTVSIGTPQEMVELQLQMYAKLARFTKLRELRLGFLMDTSAAGYRRADKEYFRQYDCLAMTVESGVGLLKALKALRVVGLEDMEVYIESDKEQNWFAEHWPNAVIGVTDYENRDSDQE